MNEVTREEFYAFGRELGKLLHRCPPPLPVNDIAQWNQYVNELVNGKEAGSIRTKLKTLARKNLTPKVSKEYGVRVPIGDWLPGCTIGSLDDTLTKDELKTWPGQPVHRSRQG